MEKWLHLEMSLIPLRKCTPLPRSQENAYPIDATMCTATIVQPAADSPRPDGTEGDGAWLLRVVFNRDEGRRRAEGLPPEVRTFDGVPCVMPVDPVSDGTWIAVNEFGLTFFLLNYYPRRAAQVGRSPSVRELENRPSRGTIIPRVAHARSLDESLSVMESLTVAAFAGFRLVVVGDEGAVELAHRESHTHLDVRRDPTFPQLYVSSGLGDEVVEGPLRALFQEMFSAGRDPIATQECYQRHSWPEAPHVSVCMRREEAMTVSQTIVDVFSHRVRMVYLPGPPDEGPSPVEVVMDRSSGFRLAPE